MTVPGGPPGLPLPARCVADAKRWRPLVGEVLRRHRLFDPAVVPAAGLDATYPTFVCGDSS